VKPEIYQDLIIVVYISIGYLVGIIDTYIRPHESQAIEEGGYAKFIILLFLIAPFLLILALMENQWIFDSRSLIISIIGLVIYFSGALFVLLSRLQLGKQATGVLVIIEDHELIDTGLYRYVRHPIYGGSLIGIMGFALVVQSIIISTISFILYFIIFQKRANYEEKLLIKQFGEKYIKYIESSKRFIPFIY
jgi:protein-S-isoprenylcysteine O-methyltransferase Ste14